MAKPKKKVITERHTRATTRMPNKSHKVHLPAWVMLKYFPKEEKVAHTVRINVCVNIKTGKMLPIPNHMNPRTELDALGLQDPVTGISSAADYYSFTANGKKATYHWLYITEEDRWRVNALERVNPLKDGHLRSYEIKEIAGVETVVDVSPSPNTKIIGTNKIISGDTNGAALLFKKGGGK